MYTIISTQDYEEALDYISKNPGETKTINTDILKLEVSFSMKYIKEKNEVEHTITSFLSPNPICQFRIKLVDYISGILKYVINGIPENAIMRPDIISFGLGDISILSDISSICINEYNVSKFIFGLKNADRFRIERDMLIEHGYPMIELYSDGRITLCLSCTFSGNYLILNNADKQTRFSFTLTHENVMDIANKKTAILFSDVRNNILSISYSEYGYITIKHMETI